MDTIETLKLKLAEERKKRAKQRQHQYYLENKERYIEAAKRYQAANRDKMKEYQKEYFQKLKGTTRYYERLSKQITVKKEKTVKTTVTVKKEKTVEPLLSIPTPEPQTVITVTEEMFTVSFE